MKVLHVVGDLGQGGIQNYVCDLVKQQALNEQLDTDMVLLYTKGPLWQRVVSVIGTIKFLNLESAKDISGMLRLVAYIKNSNADVVHVHVIHPLMGPILRYTGIPAVYTEHGGGLLAGKWQNKLIYRFFRKCFCKFIANSNITKQAIMNVNKHTSQNLRVVYNGVDLDKIKAQSKIDVSEYSSYISSYQYTVGIIARLVDQKGVDIFINTAAEICKIRNDVGFVIVGDGPLRQSLQDNIDEQGLSDRVIILGYRNDQISILKSWDIYLFTSVEEAFGLVIIEAMASGIPVLAARQKTAVAEIIDNNQNGVYIDDAIPELLAQKASDLIDDADFRRQLSLKAINKVEQYFCMQTNEKQVFEIYQSCYR